MTSIKTKSLLIANIDWSKTPISTIFPIINYNISNKEELEAITIYSKQDGTNFYIDPNKGYDSIGILTFKSEDSAQEIYNLLNDVEVDTLTFDLRFIDSKLIENLEKVDSFTKKDFEEIESEKVDDSGESQSIDDDLREQLLDGMNKEEDSSSNSKEKTKRIKKESSAEISEKAQKDEKSTKKSKKQKKINKFVPNLDDERFSEFYTNQDFIVDKSSHQYSCNSGIDVFVQEKARRNGEL